jgi:signal transduction histidine kinase
MNEPVSAHPIPDFAALVDACVDLIAIFDRDLRQVYANEAVCQSLGRPLGALLGRRYDELGISTTHAALLRETLEAVFATGESRRIEVLNLVTQGAAHRPKVHDVLCQAVLAPDGSIAHVATLARDVSALRHAEEDARQTADRLGVLVDAVGVAILGVDKGLCVRFSNQLARTEFVEPGTDQPRNLSRSPLLREPLVAKALARAFATGAPSAHEVELGLRGRGRRFEVLIRPERDPDGEVTSCVIVTRDVTAERQLQSQLHLSERLASLGRIAAGVAHEIANPLTAVYGNLELIDRSVAQFRPGSPHEHELLAEVSDMLREAREGAVRIRSIVDDIGLLARDGDLTSGRVALEDVVRTVLQIEGAAVRRHARLDLHLEPVALVSGSAPRLVQVLSNLLRNALQAVMHRPPVENVVAIHLAQAGAEVHLAVIDNGVGIPASDRERIFDPFFTTRPVGEGAGLGLTVAHDIVAQHRGRIRIDSAVGRGTEATVILPCAED